MPAERFARWEGHLVHLPDLKFFQWCNRAYRVNKGIYNTIDQTLFQAGLQDVRLRRRAILQFLHMVQEQQEGKQGDGRYLRFGHGGLTKMLQQFIQGRSTSQAL